MAQCCESSRWFSSLLQLVSSPQILLESGTLAHEAGCRRLTSCVLFSWTAVVVTENNVYVVICLRHGREGKRGECTFLSWFSRGACAVSLVDA